MIHFKNRLFFALAFLSLATVAGAASATSAVPTTDEEAVKAEFEVSRLVPFTVLDDFEQDAGIALITTDVSDYCQQNLDDISGADLARYLSERHEGVGTPETTEVEYIYRIDSDGYIHQICLLNVLIEINDGGDSPVHVSVHLATEL